MSHGPVDVFAARSGKVLLIQVKSGSAKVKKEELELLKSYAKAFNAEAQVWSFRKRGIIQKTSVNKRATSKVRPLEEKQIPVSSDGSSSSTVTASRLQFPKMIVPPS